MRIIIARDLFFFQNLLRKNKKKKESFLFQILRKMNPLHAKIKLFLSRIHPKPWKAKKKKSSVPPFLGSVCARQLTTGMTWVTPSPLSMTVPVSVLSPTCLDVQEAARARTACNNTAGDVKVVTTAAPEQVRGHNNIHVLGGTVLTTFCFNVVRFSISPPEVSYHCSTDIYLISSIFFSWEIQSLYGLY